MSRFATHLAPAQCLHAPFHSPSVAFYNTPTVLTQCASTPSICYSEDMPPFTRVNVKELRESLGMTKTAFSELVGIGYGTLQRWEKEQHKQTMSMELLVYLLSFPENIERLKARGERPIGMGKKTRLTLDTLDDHAEAAILGVDGVALPEDEEDSDQSEGDDW